ncbi:SUF system Fe-S cluster assembly protein [Deltaproteobacteria bacterium PRO3]|nr:SUF system Fe-S cluster assembly protein [Deltaproteobacteria bacterium PRO3]
MSSTTPIDKTVLEQKVLDVLATCYDPEIPVNIYELGLIYKIDIDDNKNVGIQMTLTSPMCPVAGSLPGEVQSKIQAIEGIGEVKVDLVWEPPWGPDRMSEAAKLQLNVPL